MWSVLVPGIGQLYAGAPARGAAVWIASRVAGAGLLWAAVTLPGRTGLAAQVLGMATVRALAAADAARVTRRAAPGAGRRWYNRGLVYVGLWCAAVAAWLPLHVLEGQLIADTLRVATDAMAPLLITGDRVYAVPRRDDPIRRGELVVYRLWNTRYVKRVVGVPGDTLAMRAGTLSVNQSPLTEPYASHVGERDVADRRFAWQLAYVPPAQRDGYAPTLATWGPLVVPSDAYFVLGDARGVSVDSRYHGFVADTTVLDRAVSIYFSRDPATGRLRWGRFGATVR